MTPRPDETPQEIAARYGARVACGVKVTRCPPHIYAEQLADPGNWKEQSRKGRWRIGQASRNRKSVERGNEVRRRLLELADGTRTRSECARLLAMKTVSLSMHIKRLIEAGHEPRFKERGR